MGKILVMTSGDQPLWEKHLRDQIRNLYDKQEIRYTESNKKGPTAVRTQTEPYKGVKEAYGDPVQLCKEIGETEILVIGFEPVTEDLLEKAKHLKLVASTRGGPVNVDVKAATKRGIIVTRTQGRLAQPVADHTLGLMLSEARNIARQDSVLKDGRYFDPDQREVVRATWRQVPEMEEKTLGIIGFGFVGREVAKRALGFGMKILAFDPYQTEERVTEAGGELVDLETLLQQSDFVSLNARETPETFHMISTSEFELMKPTATIINTARGSLIDEAALIKALKDKKIGAAALDVYEDEPLKADNPLLKFHNVTLTPHTAGASDRMNERSISLTAELVGRYLRGEKFTPMDVVDPEILKKI